MTGPTNMFWDSCVFIRWLTQQPADYVGDIDSYINDARRGDRKIYFSTIAFAEIRPRYLRAGGHLSMQAFMDDFQGVFFPVDPTPNVMIAAGELRDAQSVNPGDATAKGRQISTPDAIQLATCVHLKRVLEVSDVVFHTFDDGGAKGWEGKCVPLLTFEKWFPSPRPGGIVHQVCELTRSPPLYPQPGLFAPPTPSGGRTLAL